MYGMLMAEGAEGFKLTSDMFSGITSTISDNSGVLVPVGLTIFAIILSIKLVPKILSKFVH